MSGPGPTGVPTRSLNIRGHRRVVSWVRDLEFGGGRYKRSRGEGGRYMNNNREKHRMGEKREGIISLQVYFSSIGCQKKRCYSGSKKFNKIPLGYSVGIRRFSSAQSLPTDCLMSSLIPVKTGAGITICHIRVMFSRSSFPINGNSHPTTSGNRS